MLSLQIHPEATIEVTSYLRIQKELLETRENVSQLKWGENSQQGYRHLSRMATLRLQLARWQGSGAKRTHLDEMRSLILKLDSDGKRAIRHLCEHHIEELHANRLGPNHPAIQEKRRIALWTTMPTISKEKEN